MVIARKVRSDLNCTADFDGRRVEEIVAGKTLYQILNSCYQTLRHVVPDKERNFSAQMNTILELQ